MKYCPANVRCSPFCCHAARCNCGAAAKSLKAAVNDVAILVHLMHTLSNKLILKISPQTLYKCAALQNCNPLKRS